MDSLLPTSSSSVLNDTSNAVTAKMKLVIRPAITSNSQNKPPPELIELRGVKAIELGRSIKSGIVIYSLQVSRIHCEFIYKDSHWCIVDKSSNGMMLNSIYLKKYQPKAISHGDLVHIVPGGTPEAIGYSFEYVPSRPPVTSQSNNDSFYSFLIDLEEDQELNNLRRCPIISNSDNKLTPTKRSHQKPSVEMLSNLPNTSRNGRSLKRSKAVESTSSSFTMKEEDEDELPDLDTNAIVGRSSPIKKQPKLDSNIETDKSQITSSTTKFTSASNAGEFSSPSKYLLQFQSSGLDGGESDATFVMKEQLKKFIQQVKELKAEKVIIETQRDIAIQQVRREMAELKATVDSEKTEKLRQFFVALESELNCCVCNELFIQPTTIDCGHTFCNHCITEWKKKKSDCPICRKMICKCIKQIELNNFLEKLQTFLSPDARAQREQVLKERNEEIQIAKALETDEPGGLNNGPLMDDFPFGLFQMNGQLEGIQLEQIMRSNRVGGRGNRPAPNRRSTRRRAPVNNSGNSSATNGNSAGGVEASSNPNGSSNSTAAAATRSSRGRRNASIRRSTSNIEAPNVGEIDLVDLASPENSPLPHPFQPGAFAARRGLLPRLFQDLFGQARN